MVDKKRSEELRDEANRAREWAGCAEEFRLSAWARLVAAAEQAATHEAIDRLTAVMSERLPRDA